MPLRTNCSLEGTCDLKRVQLIERKLKVILPNEKPEYANYMTDMRFVVETTKPSDIPSYGLVQFVKGCMFESSLQNNGSTARDFSYVHRHFGQYRLMRHTAWVVDSSHVDPVATSFETHGRFDLYKWNKDPANLDADNAIWYFHTRPPHGTVFKADLIGTSGLIEDTTSPRARNSSLDLETCIFKISDLPLTTDPEGTGIDRTKALWCAAWDHKFVYDFSSSSVVQETTIHPFCSEPRTGPLYF